MFISFDLVTTKILRDIGEYTLVDSPKTIVLGHSHPECAFNDRILSKTTNISQSGEAYFYTYLKLQKVIEQNDGIQRLFVEFGNNQIGERMNSWIWGEKYLSDRYPRYSHLMTFSDRATLIKGNPLGYTSVFPLNAKKRVERFFEKDYNFSDEIGGYRDLKREKTDSLVKVYASKPIFKSNQEKPVPISEVHLLYLRKIITLAKINNIDVVLVRSPVYPRAHGYTNEEQYQEILSSFKKEVTYMDFAKFPLLNEEYGDFEHLNYKGANVFSTWLEEALQNGLLHMENKQAFIDSEFERMSSRLN
jgi:hypothetical protein